MIGQDLSANWALAGFTSTANGTNRAAFSQVAPHLPPIVLLASRLPAAQLPSSTLYRRPYTPSILGVILPLFTSSNFALCKGGYRARILSPFVGLRPALLHVLLM